MSEMAEKEIVRVTAADLKKSPVVLFGLGAVDQFHPPCLPSDVTIELRPMTLVERRAHARILENCARLEGINQARAKALESGDLDGAQMADYSDEWAKAEDILFACVQSVAGMTRADGQAATIDDLKAGAPDVLKGELFRRIQQISGITRDDEANLGC
jgi:hypothetical protein